jgi:hypothetical protein
VKIQTFISKLTIDALQQMDQNINRWIETKQVTPQMVNQVFGYERPHEGRQDEPVFITSIWY